MVRKFLIPLFLVLSLATLHAEELPGVIYTADDTLNVFIKVPVDYINDHPLFWKLQNGMKYFDEEGQKQKLKPEDALAIKIDYYGTEYTMVSKDKSGPFGMSLKSGKRIFVYEIIGGHQKLYRYYEYDKSNMGNPLQGFNYLQRGDGTLVSTDNISFKNKIADYFSDCPVLQKKILNKEYRREDLIKIVKFYNNQCSE